MRHLKPALLYFALVLGTGFVFGTIRVPFLVPRIGERYAELVEMPFMLVAIVLAARHVIRRFELPSRTPVRLQVGFAALALSVCAEILLAAWLQGRSLAQFLTSRDPVSGSVYLVMLLLFALMPWILARLSGTSAGHRQPIDARRALVAVKVVHTIAWAFFAGCILAIPVASWMGHHGAAVWLIGIVLLEVAILVGNGWRCPLTSLAGRYTAERHDNFDIYLPLWLARHNKTIFGVLYGASIVFAYCLWRAR